MPDVFLSYSREDQVTARRFAEGLQREGFDVWWDQALTIGEAFDKITENALDEARAVVVLWSRTSVDSCWVRAEATQTQASGRLAPVHTSTLRTNPGEFVRFWRPVARDVRRLPGFKALVREMGLVDYWREYGWPDLCHPVGSNDFECN